MKLRRSIPNEQPAVTPLPSPPLAIPARPKPAGLLVSITTFLVLTIGIVWLNGPADEAPLPAQTLQPNRMDTDRHLIWVRLDSLQNRLDLLTGDNGLSIRSGTERLYIQASNRKQLERYLLNGLALTRFTQAANSPVRLESAGDGFSLPIQQRQGITYVQVPTDIISSLLRSTESLAE
jgi:hypothetical protein